MTPAAVPSVPASQLVTDAGATFSFTINANGAYKNATIYFGDGTSQVITGGAGTNITASHVFKNAGFYLIWYVINYTYSAFVGVNDLIPVEVFNTQMNQNASMGMVVNTNGGFISQPGSNASWFLYYNSMPDQSYNAPYGTSPYQVYNQYFVVKKAGQNGNYGSYYSRNLAYSFNSSTSTYTYPITKSYYNMTNLQSGFYQLKLSTASATVNQSTGALGSAIQNTTAVWDFVVNSSSGTSTNTSSQLFNRVEPMAGNVSLDPQMAYLPTSVELLMNTMQTLVGMEGSNTTSFYPYLASALPTPGNGINNAPVTRTIQEYVNGAWTSSTVTYAPSQVYTFTIRSNATWQNGQRVTAWDAAFSIMRDLLFVNGNPGTPGWLLAQAFLPGGSYQANTYQNITNNVTWSNSSHTVTLYLQQPTPPHLLFDLVSAPGSFIGDANWTYLHGEGLGFTPSGFANYTKYGNAVETNSYLFTHIMSDGPYVLAYNMPGNIAYLEKNPAYNPPVIANGTEWAPAAKINNIQIIYSTDQYGSFFQFSSGWAQSISQQMLSTPQWQQVQNMTNQKIAAVDSFPTLSLFWFNFNARVNMSMLQSLYPNANLPSELFASNAVRKAFAYSFPYDQYLNKFDASPLQGVTFYSKYAGMLDEGMLYNQSIAELNATTTGVPYFNLGIAQSFWSTFVNSSMGSAMGITYSASNGIDLYNGLALNIPLFTFPGSAPDAMTASNWITQLQQVIPGFQSAVLPTQFFQLINFMVQGQNPMPVYELGWGPDYAYPSDYLGPMANPANGSTYPGPNSMTPYWFNGDPANPLMGQQQMIQQANNLTTMVDEYQNATGSQTSQAKQWFQAMNEMLINMTFYVYTSQQSTVFVLSNDLNISLITHFQENGVTNSGGDLYFNTISYNEYTVTFTQTGLPSTSAWYVTLTDKVTYGPITGSTAVIPLANGTYNYTVLTPNTSYNSPQPGNFVVTGKQLSLNIAFIGKTSYKVVFSETGLGTNSQWFVNISGMRSSGPLASTTTTFTANVFNGTYSFTIASANKIYKPVYSSRFTVNGATLTISVSFVLVKYAVAFTESGLTSGTAWNVTVGGVTLSSSSNSISFSEVNGSYSYSIQGIHGYSVASYGGFTVTGSAINIPVSFSKNATVDLHISTPNAVLTVDGIPTAYGTGSTVLSLQQGYHFLNASETGYETSTNLFYFGPSLYYVNISLVKLTTYGYLVGNVSPADAFISASGISVSVTNGKFNQSLTPGSYYVSAAAQGFASADYLVNITNGHTSYLNIALKSVNQSYTISGTVSPANSSVMFGSYTAYVNSTGFYTINLPAGNYNYSVADSGYFPSTGSVDVTSDLTLNFVLVKTPPPQSVVVTSSIQASGYNLTVSNLTNGNGNISVTFSANVNGTLVVQIPYSQIKNATISDILTSKVYVNGTSYSNFTIALSNLNGTFSVILTVNGLKGDPVMEWAYLPNVLAPLPSPPAPAPKPKPFVVPWYAYVAVLDAVVVATAYMVGRNMSKRKKQKK